MILQTKQKHIPNIKTYKTILIITQSQRKRISSQMERFINKGKASALLHFIFVYICDYTIFTFVMVHLLYIAN